MQKLESLIQVEVKKGNIVIESGMIEGADVKIFEL